MGPSTRHICVPIEEAKAANKPIISMKWADRNKGDTQRPNYRSRLVCREIKRASNADFIPEYASFSAMPPTESLRILLSSMVTLKRSKAGHPLKVRLIDISRAHFYWEAERDVFVELPEGDRQDGFCDGWFAACMGLVMHQQFGMQRCYTDLLLGLGFVKNPAWPSCFYHKAMQMRVLVHQGLLNVPFWVYWTSPYSSHYRPYT